MLELEQQLFFGRVQRDARMGQFAQMDQDSQTFEKREQRFRRKVRSSNGAQQFGMEGIAADSGGIIQVAEGIVAVMLRRTG